MTPYIEVGILSFISLCALLMAHWLQSNSQPRVVSGTDDNDKSRPETMADRPEEERVEAFTLTPRDKDNRANTEQWR